LEEDEDRFTCILEEEEHSEDEAEFSALELLNVRLRLLLGLNSLKSRGTNSQFKCFYFSLFTSQKSTKMIMADFGIKFN
jgi:hypothetical protein